MHERANSYINTEIEILLFILTRSVPRKRHRRIIGYDLCSANFDKPVEHLNCSRKKFRTRKNSLLKRKLIQISFQNEKTTYYTITPLGICYLSQQRELNKPNVLTAIEIMERFYETTKLYNPDYVKLKGIRNDLKEMEIEEEIIQEKFLSVCKNQTIIQTEHDDVFQYHIILSAKIPNQNIKWEMGEFLIMHDGPELEKFKLQAEKIKKERIKKSSVYTGNFNPESDIFINYLFFEPSTKDFVQQTNMDIFNFRISDFVLKGLLFELCDLPEVNYWNVIQQELEKSGEMTGEKLKKVNEIEHKKYSKINKSFLRIAKSYGQTLHSWLGVAQQGLNQSDYRFDDAMEFQRTGRTMYLPDNLQTSKGLKIAKEVQDKEKKRTAKLFPEPDFDYMMHIHFDKNRRKMAEYDEGWFEDGKDITPYDDSDGPRY